MHIVTTFVEDLIPPDWRSTVSGWHNGNCKMCVENGEARHDTKRRGGFHLDTDSFYYYCFNCGYTAHWSAGDQLSYRVKQLFKTFGADDAAIHKLTIELLRDQDTPALLVKEPDTKKTPYIIDWKESTLPHNTKHILDSDQSEDRDGVLEYLITERGIDPSKYDLRYSPATKPSMMNRRVVVPFIFNEKIVGFTARLALPVDGLELTKYHNSMPPDFVFNLDNQHDEREVVIVTEGIFDAMAIDGVAIGTNKISENQSKIINQLGKRVIMLPDFDSAGKHAVDRAIENGWDVSFPPWAGEYKDAAEAVAEYGQLFVIQTTIEFATANSTKIQVLSKQYCK